MKAVEIASSEIVKLLIDHGCALDFTDKNGRTALICAIEFGNLKIAEILVKAGVDTNIQNKVRH